MKSHGFYIYVQIYVCTHTPPYTPLAWSSLDSPSCLPAPYGKPTFLRVSKRLSSFSLYFSYEECDPQNKFGYIKIFVNNLMSLIWSQKMYFSPKTVEQIILLHCPFDDIALLFTFLISYSALSCQI